METLRAGRGVAGRTLGARRAAARTGHANCRHDSNIHGSGGWRERQEASSGLANYREGRMWVLSWRGEGPGPPSLLEHLNPRIPDRWHDPARIWMGCGCPKPVRYYVTNKESGRGRGCSPGMRGLIVSAHLPCNYRDAPVKCLCCK